MKLNEIRAVNALGQRVRFSRDEEITIALLVHDKAHVLGRRNKRHAVLDRVIEHFATKSPELWRGIYKQELKAFEVGDTFNANGYMSFSENKSIAERFGGTKVLLHLKTAHAFPYWQWNIENLQLPLKKKDPEAFENNDGEYAIESLKEEGEWITPYDAKFEVLGKRNDGEYTIVDIKQI